MIEMYWFTSFFRLNKVGVALLSLSWGLMLLSCGGPSEDKLTGVTEGGNTSASITGRTIYPNGTQVGFAYIKLRPADYRFTGTSGKKKGLQKKESVVLADTVLGDNGEFTFTGIDSGSYLIEINDGKQGVSILPITILPEEIFRQLPLDTLYKSVKVIGNIPLDSLGLLPIQKILILGLERDVVIDNQTGDYQIEELDEGLYNFVLIQTNTGKELIVKNVPINKNELDKGEIEIEELETAIDIQEELEE